MSGGKKERGGELESSDEEEGEKERESESRIGTGFLISRSR